MDVRRAEAASLQDQVNEINRKLDVILEEIELQRKLRRETESTQDFLRDFTPISRELFIDAMNKLDELDRKGYFEFMRELVRVNDRIVTSFSPEDVRRLGESIVAILETVKSLSQQDVLQAVNNALAVYRKLDREIPEKVSTWSLLRELNTPEMRRGLAYLVRFQKSLVALEAENGQEGTN